MLTTDVLINVKNLATLAGMICILLMTGCTSKKLTLKQQVNALQDTTRTERQHLEMKAPQDTVTYASGSRFIQGFARVKIESTSFYIDTTGRRAFDEILFPDDYQMHQFATIERGSRDTTSLPKDYVYVRKGSKYGILTITGEWLLKPKYDDINTRLSSFWEVSKDGKQSHYGPDGFMLPFKFDSVNYLDGRRFDVKKNGAWGVYDAKMDKMIIPAKYQMFDYCGGCEAKGGYVFAKKNGKWGIVNFQNEVLIPFEYEHHHSMMRSDEWVKSLYKNGERMIINLKTGIIKPAEQFNKENNNEKVVEMADGFVKKQKNRKWGMLNSASELVLPYKYDYIHYESDSSKYGLPAPYVRINDMDFNYGLADTTGTIIIPTIYQNLISSDYNNLLFTVVVDGEKLVLDHQGDQVLPKDAKDIGKIVLGEESGSAKVMLVTFKIDGRYGFYNPVTDELIEPKYTHIKNYSVFVSNHLLRVIKNGKKGVINIHGEVVLPVKYDKLYGYNLDHLGLVITVKEDKRGVFDLEQRQMIIPQKYDHISTPYENSNVFRLELGEKSGLAKVDGTVMTPIAFNRIIKVGKGNFLLTKKDVAGNYIYKILYMRTGEIDSLPFRYVELSGTKGILIVTENDGQKLYDISTQNVVQGEYAKAGFPDNIERFYNGRARIKENGKFGFINLKGDVIVPPTYDNASFFYHGVAMVMKEQPASRRYFYGYIDSTGSVIVPVEYEYKPNSLTRDYYENGYLVLYKFPDTQMNYLKGYATKTGEILIKPRYEAIYPNHSGDNFLVKKERKYGVLNAFGEVLIPAVCDEVKLNQRLRYNGPGYVADFNFPLMCRQGEQWLYFDRKGNQLPVIVEDNISFYRNGRPF